PNRRASRTPKSSRSSVHNGGASSASPVQAGLANPASQSSALRPPARGRSSVRLSHLTPRLPNRKRTDKARLWYLVKKRDVFDGMSVGIGKVNLRRRHPTDD